MIKIGEKTLLEEELANLFLKQISDKNNSILCLATGNSPVGVYQRLINLYQQKKLSFKNITTYNLDEYLNIKADDTDSFRFFMKEKLFDHIDILENNIHFPLDPNEYNKELDKINKFDLTLLGVGVNGHIAFNEPGSLFERTHKVKLSNTTLESNFSGRLNYPTEAITMGLEDIFLKSKKIILLAWGKNKTRALQAYQKALASKIKDPSWPITQFIDHPDFTIYTDQEINK